MPGKRKLTGRSEYSHPHLPGAFVHDSRVAVHRAGIAGFPSDGVVILPVAVENGARLLKSLPGASGAVHADRKSGG